MTRPGRSRLTLTWETRSPDVKGVIVERRAAGGDTFRAHREAAGRPDVLRRRGTRGGFHVLLSRARLQCGRRLGVLRGSLRGRPRGSAARTGLRPGPRGQRPRRRRRPGRGRRRAASRCGPAGGRLAGRGHEWEHRHAHCGDIQPDGTASWKTPTVAGTATFELEGGRIHGTRPPCTRPATFTRPETAPSSGSLVTTAAAPPRCDGLRELHLSQPFPTRRQGPAPTCRSVRHRAGGGGWHRFCCYPLPWRATGRGR